MEHLPRRALAECQDGAVQHLGQALEAVFRVVVRGWVWRWLGRPVTDGGWRSVGGRGEGTGSGVGAGWCDEGLGACSAAAASGAARPWGGSDGASPGSSS